jgi:site-specific DNA-methyltransferase (adenine-specific)
MNKNKTVQIGNCTLISGNSYDILPTLNIKADSVITDPPYGITACEWDEDIMLPLFWDIIDRSAKPSANFVFFAAGRFLVDLVNSKYRWYRYDLVWVKNNKIGFLNSGKQPMRSHEHILLFGRNGEKSGTTYNPIKSEGKPYTRVHHNENSVYPARSYVTKSDGKRHPGSVLNFKSDKDILKIHPTLKPLKLMEYLVTTYTNKNDTVIDPFMGSGTTGVACRKLGRKFIGIEKEKKYFDVAVERIKEL